MSIRSVPLPPRRALLAAALTSPLAAPALAQDMSARTVHFFGWSAALSTLRDQIASFMSTSGLRVVHQHYPWGSYRTALLARLLGQSPVDVAWLSDSWLPEFSRAGWIAPINDIPQLMRFNAEARPVCTEAMTTGGQQYGLAYYADNMAFLYNAEILRRAGITAPPTSWGEVMEQSRHIQRRSLVEHALTIPLASDPWLIEFISTLVFSFGGSFIDAQNRPVMAEGDGGAIAALEFLREAIHHERVLSAASVDASEPEVLEAFGAGRHAFAILPTYRLRVLNDPTRHPEAGHFRIALMPNGGTARNHETCGWVRFYAMTSAAGANPPRRANATQFIQAFGGRNSAGQYAMQKQLLLDTGQPFCTTPLFDDPDVVRYAREWSGGGEDVIREQMARVRNKDTIAPWFANWQGLTDQIWQAVCLDTLSPRVALGIAAEAWLRLQRNAN